MPPWINSPVAGSSGIWPEAKTRPFALIACEYGPIAFGAPSVWTGSVILGSLLSPGLNTTLKQIIISKGRVCCPRRVAEKPTPKGGTTNLHPDRFACFALYVYHAFHRLERADDLFQVFQVEDFRGQDEPAAAFLIDLGVYA